MVQPVVDGLVVRPPRQRVVLRHVPQCGLHRVDLRQRLQNQILSLTAWERLVWNALNDPGVYRILEAGGFKLPPPPIPEGPSGATRANT